MFYITLATFFVLAALGDTLTITYHRHREAGRTWATAGTSMLLEALSWAPVLFVVTTGDLGVAFASVAGSGLGTAWGLRRNNR